MHPAGAVPAPLLPVPKRTLFEAVDERNGTSMRGSALADPTKVSDAKAMLTLTSARWLRRPTTWCDALKIPPNRSIGFGCLDASRVAGSLEQTPPAAPWSERSPPLSGALPAGLEAALPESRGFGRPHNCLNGGSRFGVAG